MNPPAPGADTSARDDRAPTAPGAGGSGFPSLVRGREEAVGAYLRGFADAGWLPHHELRQGVWAYLQRPGKRLRPVVLLLSGAALGGRDEELLPAAAGVEVFHTWTLVHDDVIDRDETRRGGPTVHEMFARRARESGAPASAAADFGRTMAILVGDSQHALAVWLFLETARRTPALTAVTLRLVQHLCTVVINRLIAGEVRDVQFAGRPVGGVPVDEVLEMLHLKTGVLYEFAALAGAALGLNEANWDHPHLRALAAFAARCGTAFQLQDDILGVIGDERTLGKPVGSDIREGKRTTITYFAFRNATPAQRSRLESILGDRSASPERVREATGLLVELGGVQETAALAARMTREALPLLEGLPAGESRDLLGAWAEYLVHREF